MLRGSCWCLQNQIGVWSPPKSSGSWNTECMPLGDRYVLGAECVAVELNSGPLRHCWRRCCCRVKALAAFSNSIGFFLGWIILRILQLQNNSGECLFFVPCKAPHNRKNPLGISNYILAYITFISQKLSSSSTISLWLSVIVTSWYLNFSIECLTVIKGGDVTTQPCLFL